MPEPIKTNIAPWLSVRDAGEAADFYKAAFAAVELYRMEEEDGKLAVARLSVDGADFWIQNEPGADSEAAGGGPIRMIITVEDPDSMFALALSAGAVEIAPIAEDYGWRVGRISDPFGYHWEIGKQIES